MAYVKKEPLCAWLEYMGVSAYIVNTIQDEAHFPSEDVVEVKHGEWIWKQLYGEIWSTLVCSECEESEGANKNFDYCPNCSAKMDGRKE